MTFTLNLCTYFSFRAHIYLVCTKSSSDDCSHLIQVKAFTNEKLIKYNFYCFFPIRSSCGLTQLLFTYRHKILLHYTPLIKVLRQYVSCFRFSLKDSHIIPYNAIYFKENMFEVTFLMYESKVKYKNYFILTSAQWK